MLVTARGLVLLLCVVGVSCQGATYTRWGRTTCGHYNDRLVYAGRAGASYYNANGGASNYLCLPSDPQWGRYSDKAEAGGAIYGVEYEVKRFNPFDRDVHDEDMPCAVCRSYKEMSLMIPARTECYPGWRKAYSGYLMSGPTAYKRTEYICVDKDPEGAIKGDVNQNGGLVYPVEAKCGSLACSPYVANRELTCVVCLM